MRVFADRRGFQAPRREQSAAAADLLSRPRRRSTPKSGEQVPDAFQGLVVVPSGLPGGTEGPWIEDPIDCQLCAELRELRSAVVRVTA